MPAPFTRQAAAAIPAPVRSASFFCFGSGTLSLVFVAAAPSILRWQARNTLEQFGAIDKVDLVVSISLGQMGPDLVIGALLAIVLIGAGFLMRARRKVGVRLFVGVLALNLLTRLANLAAGSFGGTEVIPLLWAIAGLHLLRGMSKQQGTAWWAAKA